MMHNRSRSQRADPRGRGDWQGFVSRLVGWIVGVAVLLCPALAYAAGGGGGQSELREVIVVTGLLGLGYIVVHVIERRFAHLHLLLIGGLEYIVLGVVLKEFGLLDEGTMQSLSPVISFGIGSVGLLVGLGLHKDRRPRVSDEAISGAVWSALLTFFSVGGVFYGWYLLSSESGIGPEPGRGLTQEVGAAVLVLGAAGVVSASEIVTKIIRFERPRVGFMSRTLVNTALITEVIGILVFGAVFCIFREPLGSSFREPTTIEWLFYSVSLGFTLGVLFAVFLGREKSEERLFVAGLGIVLFASGTAYYLNLSPIFVNFAVGWVLARRGAGVFLRNRLQSIEKPAFIVLAIFLGFAWEWVGLVGWVMAGLFVLVRFVGKVLGARVMYYTSENQGRYAQGLGTALSAQGGLVAAMALNYHQVYDSSLRPIVVNCLVVGLLVNEFIGRRGIRNLLVNAKELLLDGERREAIDPDAPIDWGDDRESPWLKPSNKEDAEVETSPASEEPPEEPVDEWEVAAREILEAEAPSRESGEGESHHDMSPEPGDALPDGGEVEAGDPGRREETDDQAVLQTAGDDSHTAETDGDANAATQGDQTQPAEDQAIGDETRSSGSEDDGKASLGNGGTPEDHRERASSNPAAGGTSAGVTPQTLAAGDQVDPLSPSAADPRLVVASGELERFSERLREAVESDEKLEVARVVSDDSEGPVGESSADESEPSSEPKEGMGQESTS